MAEYIECGAALGWFIDPDQRRVLVYRPGAAPESVVALDDPSEISADPILAGFVLQLAELW
jgi:Uma2 family endonuclease